MSPSPVYVLGVGNLGKLVAHSLRAQHPALPIVLLFHRAGLAQAWSQAGQRIEVVRNGVTTSQHGFTHESVGDNGGEEGGGRRSGKIQELVVATKTHATVEALRAIRGRLGPWSTLLFLQNGIGTIDQVTTALFPDTATRPRYLAGILNHGVYATSTFGCVHAGVADAVIGPVPSSSDCIAASDNNVNDNNNNNNNNNVTTTSPMAQAMAACPTLAATLVSPVQLLAAQWQKLAVNAVINPLTVLLDCRNGELFAKREVLALVEPLIMEIAHVVQAVLRAQGPSVGAHVAARLDAERLRAAVLEVGRRTADNVSSMRQDRLAGRETEIDAINGYLVSQGVKYGVPCPLNARIVQLVKDKRHVKAGQIQDMFGV